MRKKVVGLFCGAILMGFSVGIVATIANGKIQGLNVVAETKRQDNSLVSWDYGKEAVTISEHERAILDNNVWSCTEDGKIYVYCCNTKETMEIYEENAKEYLSLPQGTYKLYSLQSDGSRMDVSAYLSVETYYDGTEQEGVISIN